MTVDSSSNSLIADQPRWNTGDHRSSWKTFGNNRAGADDAAIAKFDVFQDDRVGADPAVASDSNFPDLHGQLVRRDTGAVGMIGIRDINIRPEHVVIADLDMAAGVDHEITIKIIAAADFDSGSVERRVNGPEPAALGEGVIFPDFYLRNPPASPLAFHPVSAADSHSKRAIEKNPETAGQTARQPEKDDFEAHFREIDILTEGNEDS